MIFAKFYKELNSLRCNSVRNRPATTTFTWKANCILSIAWISTAPSNSYKLYCINSHHSCTIVTRHIPRHSRLSLLENQIRPNVLHNSKIDLGGQSRWGWDLKFSNTLNTVKLLAVGKKNGGCTSSRVGQRGVYRTRCVVCSAHWPPYVAALLRGATWPHNPSLCGSLYSPFSLDTF